MDDPGDGSDRTFESLQAWMEHYRVNTTELARRCGVSKSHISMILRGSRRCSFYLAVVISEITERQVPVRALIQWPQVPLQRTILEVPPKQGKYWWEK